MPAIDLNRFMASILIIFTKMYQLKNNTVLSKNNGISTTPDQSMYPKKLGIFIPFSSAIDLVMKLGALPI